ncbi:MAG TPA: efflux RND transporter periplasmic adaptor subunit [Cyclobacteriaceae bacterium]|jgi:membrane fusion protein (multidrug efflux system)|nr:efflux RND transporter periplasmic adaptor subunit [Cyclobacteriaceae bacterium]HRE68109.1 efflux RND transporter periplasmic adaptor subunit [Cyclobacteriaceae bacterium]HRF34722.1 efflux RND transporter periplasmic adaptor subunit [Cyclobacteriaceae bacterium]
MNINTYRLVILFVVLLLASCQSKKTPVQATNRNMGPMVVDGFLVTPQSISDKIEVPGSLLPAEETQIRTEVSGRVVRLNIQEGTTVKQGELLVKLFDQDLQASLKKLQVQLEIANKNEERLRDLLAINGISQQDYDLSKLNVENLKADIVSTQISISKTEIRAPYQGKVGLRNVSLGSYLSPTEIVTTIRQVDQLKLEFAVPEKYAKDVKAGSNVIFRVDGGNRDHIASVIATESGVDQTTRTLRIRALVTSNHAELVPGIFAKVFLQLGKTSNAMLIPTQAVLPQIRNKQVILVRKDSAFFSVVETGIRDSVYVQILSGIKPGDTVVTTGLMALRPNAKIKIGSLSRYPSK